MGTPDHSEGIDLSVHRYLRLVVDGVYLAEVDCAGTVAAATTLTEVRDKINDALTVNVAAHDNHFLTLTSPTVGSGGNIEVQAAANDAAETLFGPGVQGFYAGADDLAAVARSRRALTQPVNLQTDRFLVISVDGVPPVEIDCAGATAAETTIEEITAKLDAVNGLAVSHDGAFMTLVSESAGANSSLEILIARVEGDAANSVLGFAPRSAKGTDAAAARIEGGVDLRPSVDLRWRCRITLGVDGKRPLSSTRPALRPKRVRLSKLLRPSTPKSDRILPALTTADWCSLRLQLGRRAIWL